MKIFPKHIPTGLKHGTITVKNEDMFCEVTTFRIEGKYSDNRRPDSVEFTDDLEEDLKRRDFTINAIAYNDSEGLVDPFFGQLDLKSKVIRCVGSATERFEEDPLRIVRAIRFRYQLDFEIVTSTTTAGILKAYLLKNISAERIRNELDKTLVAIKENQPARPLLQKVLSIVYPLIENTYGFNQNNPYHKYSLWEHTFTSISLIDNKLHLRLAMLLHDLGKLSTRVNDENGISHYYNHGEISCRLAEDFMDKLKYDN